MSTRKPAREFALRRWPDSNGDYTATPLSHILYRHPDTILVREITDEPDLAPGLLKAIEMLRRLADNRACKDPSTVHYFADHIEAESTRLGLLKGDEG